MYASVMCIKNNPHHPSLATVLVVLGLIEIVEGHILECMSGFPVEQDPEVLVDDG